MFLTALRTLLGHVDPAIGLQTGHHASSANVAVVHQPQLSKQQWLATMRPSQPKRATRRKQQVLAQHQ